MRDNRDIVEKLRATIADMEYMEVPGEWLVPVEEAKAEIARLRAALDGQPAPGKVKPRTDSRYNNAERIFGDD